MILGQRLEGWATPSLHWDAVMIRLEHAEDVLRDGLLTTCEREALEAAIGNQYAAILSAELELAGHPEMAGTEDYS